MRILLTRLSALGDIVHTWPLAAALTSGGEPVELAWLVEEPFLPLVAGHPAVARLIPVATRRWRRRAFAGTTRREILAARAAVRGFAPDVALDPQGLLKSGVWGLISGAGVRVGLARSHRREWMAGACYTRTVAPPPEARHVVDVNLSLLTALGRPAPFGAAPDGRFLVGSATPAPTGAVVLLPATGGPGKAWPAASFAALGRRAAGAGLPVIVGWGPGERALAEEVVGAAGPGAALAPPTSIPELAMLLAGCAAVVAGDTGPAHLAASLGVPTVAVFVATDPARNAPRGPRVRVLAGAASAERPGSARAAAEGEVAVDPVFDALVALLDGVAAVSS